MSRWESRDSQSKRLHSRVERHSSPNRLKRDRKPATEREHFGLTDHDHRYRRRLQDALPLEAPLEAPESKISSSSAAANEVSNEVFEKPDTLKPGSNLTEVPRSLSYFQHDERGTPGQGGRSLGHRNQGKGGDSRDRFRERSGVKVVAHGQSDERIQPKRNDMGAWRHDGFFELESEAPPVKKRPAFRERKPLPETENPVPEVPASVPEVPASDNLNRSNRSALNSSKREEREGDQYLHGRPTTDFVRERFARVGDRPYVKDDGQREGFQHRERYASGGSSRGRERFNGRYNAGDRNRYRASASRGEKWKHDLFYEANRSPTPKNEEDHIAKVEALLTS
ncbi:uncharacterized protein LOC18430875 isoform X1 [Amborella trichopoda]|uniref:uncharacterized protein LOC18430875 isoform X1 n=1 Tax=Amborella trichopoda TaxID=13333 RepID=UPI0005D4500D|nr:uncharacterized protein LOC18430875 isoform X1 [Amborella trichopoda]|eukprot:XP_011622123.1 uncharacterized protein LOC18430875 isoform X1 [Amborella trichopoda]